MYFCANHRHVHALIYSYIGKTSAIMPRNKKGAAGRVSARGKECAGEPPTKKSKAQGGINRVLFLGGANDDGSGGDDTYIGEEEDYSIEDEDEDTEQQGTPDQDVGELGDEAKKKGARPNVPAMLRMLKNYKEYIGKLEREKDERKQRALDAGERRYKFVRTMQGDLAHIQVRVDKFVGRYFPSMKVLVDHWWRWTEREGLTCTEFMKGVEESEIPDGMSREELWERVLGPLAYRYQYFRGQVRQKMRGVMKGEYARFIVS